MRTTGILLVLFLVGCGAYRPPFDPKFIRDKAVFETDLSECQTVAKEQGVTIGKGGAVGAGIGGAAGAGVGAAAGSIYRRAGTGAEIGGIIGGVSGLLSGLAAGAVDQRTIITNCMVGRGYRPLR